MAREKKITRTLITGYKYDVMKKDVGDTLKKIGEVTAQTPIRSIKQQKDLLAENKLAVDNVLVLNNTVTKQYTMTEADFIKYATEVAEVSEKSGEAEE